MLSNAQDNISTLYQVVDLLGYQIEKAGFRRKNKTIFYRKNSNSIDSLEFILLPGSSFEIEYKISFIKFNKLYNDIYSSANGFKIDSTLKAKSDINFFFNETLNLKGIFKFKLDTSLRTYDKESV